MMRIAIPLTTAALLGVTVWPTILPFERVNLTVPLLVVTAPTLPPTPRAVYPISGEQPEPLSYNPSVRLAPLPKTVVIVSRPASSFPSQIVAFDRDTGRELWRKEGEQPTPKEGQVAFVRWELVGGAHGASGEVFILRRTTLAGPERGPWKPSASELYGLEGHTGKVLWKMALTANAPEDVPEPAGVFGVLVALTYPGWVGGALISSGRSVPANETRVTLLDAFTGKQVNPDTAEGRASWNRADRLAVIPGVRPRLLRLDTGTLRTIDEFSDKWFRGSAWGIGATSNRAVLRVNPDDDGAGHSVWPQYLYSTDESGKKAWQFPARLVFPMSSDAAAWRNYESLGQVALDPKAEIAYALGETNALYGVRVRDGKVLWRKPATALNALALAPYRGGCFVLTRRGNDAVGASSFVSLAWVEGRTGKLRWLTRLPMCTGIEVDGEDLFAIANAGKVRAYRCPELLALYPGTKVAARYSEGIPVVDRK